MMPHMSQTKVVSSSLSLSPPRMAFKNNNLKLKSHPRLALLPVNPSKLFPSSLKWLPRILIVVLKPWPTLCLLSLSTLLTCLSKTVLLPCPPHLILLLLSHSHHILLFLVRPVCKLLINRFQWPSF